MTILELRRGRGRRSPRVSGSALASRPTMLHPSFKQQNGGAGIGCGTLSRPKNPLGGARKEGVTRRSRRYNCDQTQSTHVEPTKPLAPPQTKRERRKHRPIRRSGSPRRRSARSAHPHRRHVSHRGRSINAAHRADANRVESDSRIRLARVAPSPVTVGLEREGHPRGWCSVRRYSSPGR